MMKQRLIYVTIAAIVILASFGELASLVHTVWGFTPFQSTTTAQVPAQTASSHTEKVASAPATPQSQIGGEFVPTHIQISTVGIDLPVVSVPLVNGTWEVHTGVANYAQGTSLVNPDSGNVGVYAHDRTNGFTEIKKLHSGDMIVLSAGSQRAEYTVTSSTTVDTNNVTVFYPSQDPELTLITCNGFFSVQRYMVKAKLTKFE